MGIWYRRFEGTDSLPEDADQEILDAFAEPIATLRPRGATRPPTSSTSSPRRPTSRRCSTGSTRSTGTTRTRCASSSTAAGFSISIPRRAGVPHRGGGRHDPRTAGYQPLVRPVRGQHIRAIRLFQDTSGWTPHYTESRRRREFQPLCFGPPYFPARPVSRVRLPGGVRAVLTDIEGTTTAVSFVYDVLFPYAAARLAEYCARPARSELAEALARLRQEYRGGHAKREPDLPPYGNGAPYARRLMEEDRKSTGLKLLQGVIWEEGYRTARCKVRSFRTCPWLWQGGEQESACASSPRAASSPSSSSSATPNSGIAPYIEGFPRHHDRPQAQPRVLPRDRTPPRSAALPDPLPQRPPWRVDAPARAGMQTGFFVRPETSRPSRTGIRPTAASPSCSISA